jgi:outer membrane protein OmpA-like peptidoglycan-associated protein
MPAGATGRATPAENLEIGEKRAKFMHDYLVKKGFKANRMIVVSKGEEELKDGESGPLDEDHRRVNFRVVQE